MSTNTLAKLAIAALLAFGSASTALAESKSRATHRGAAPRGGTPPAVFEGRGATTAPAVKPFTAEEKAWFDRASRVF